MGKGVLILSHSRLKGHSRQGIVFVHRENTGDFTKKRWKGKEKRREEKGERKEKTTFSQQHHFEIELGCRRSHGSKDTKIQRKNEVEGEGKRKRKEGRANNTIVQILLIFSQRSQAL